MTQQTSSEPSGEEMLDAAFAKISSSKVSDEEEKTSTKSTQQSRDESDDEGDGLQKVAEYDGTKQIKVDDPIIKKRLDYLYKQSRDATESNHLLIKHQKDLESALDEALSRIDKLSAKQAKEEEQEAVSMLRAKIRDARALGDDDKVDELMEMLIDLKAEQKAKKPEETKKKVEQAKASDPYVEAERIYVKGLSSETDDNGEAVRPWLKPGDKNFDFAVSQGAKIIDSHAAEGRNVGIEVVMRDLDKIMRAKIKDTQGAGGIGSDKVVKGNPNTQKFSEGQVKSWKKLGLSESELNGRMAKISKMTRVSLDDL